MQDFLREFFTYLFHHPHVILRNEELLPKKSGFDIDILINDADVQQIHNVLKKLSADYGAIYIGKASRAAIFMPSFNKHVRNWCLIDFQTKYKYGNTVLTVSDLLELDAQERLSLLQRVQNARKGLTSSEEANLLGVQPYKAKDIKVGVLQKLKRKLLNRFYCIHWHKMPLIVICGPDGVGKSTLMDNVMAIFSSMPVNTNNFHHTGLVKDNGEKTDLIKEKDMSLARRLRRRYTPQFIKVIYGTVTGEARYALKINAKIVDGFYGAKYVFSDRYIYDRAIKMRMIPGKMAFSKFITALNARLMRRPIITIIPTDHEDNIYKRKQELTPDEIRQYYHELDAVLKSCDCPNIIKIEVFGKSPEDLALETARLILQSLDPNFLFQAIGVYERNLKASSQNG